MQPKSRTFLTHMQDAASLIAQFSASRKFEDLSTDPLLRSAILYQFAIIGEALTQLRAADPNTANRITDSHRIIGFRNQLVHAYAVIRDAVTWQIIQDHLPILQKELALLLTEI